MKDIRSSTVKTLNQHLNLNNHQIIAHPLIGVNFHYTELNSAEQLSHYY